MERLRKVRHKENGYVLETWDTYKTDSMGKTVIRYDFRKQGEIEPLFAGSDFACGRFTAIDSDECLLSLLGFLTLRSGDTDSEYFEAYTDAQNDWSESGECEQMQCDIACLEESEHEFSEAFEELDGDR